MNRVRFERSLKFGVLSDLTEAKDEVDTDDDEDRSFTPSAPIVPLHGRLEQVVYPTTVPAKRHLLVHGGENHVPTDGCCRAALVRHLGEARVAAVERDCPEPGTAMEVVIRSMDSKKIRIRAVDYATAVSENRNPSLITTRAWFAIRGRDVPAYVAECDYLMTIDDEFTEDRKQKALDSFVYGRMLRFFSIQVNKGARVGRNRFVACLVEVYKTTETHKVTRLDTVDRRWPLLIGGKTCYIDAEKVDCQVAIGPKLSFVSRTSTARDVRIQTEDNEIIMLPLHR